MRKEGMRPLLAFLIQPETIMPRDLWQKAKDRDVAQRQRREPKDFNSIPLQKPSRRKKVASIKEVSSARKPVGSPWRQGPLGEGLPFVMPFGKYVGRPLEQVPCGYLEWLLSLDNLYPKTRLAILKFLTAKQGGVIKGVARNGTTALGPHPETSPDRTDPPW